MDEVVNQIEERECAPDFAMRDVYDDWKESCGVIFHSVGSLPISPAHVLYVGT